MKGLKALSIIWCLWNCCAAWAAGQALSDADLKDIQLIDKLVKAQEKAEAGKTEDAFIESLRDLFNGDDKADALRALSRMKKFVKGQPGTPLKKLLDSMEFARDSKDWRKDGGIEPRRVTEAELAAADAGPQGRQSPGPAASRADAAAAKPPERYVRAAYSKDQKFAKGPPSPFSRIQYFNEETLPGIKEEVGDLRDVVGAKVYRVETDTGRELADGLGVKHHHLVYAAQYRHRDAEGKASVREFVRPFGYVGSFKSTLGDWQAGVGPGETREVLADLPGRKEALRVYLALVAGQEKMTGEAGAGDLDYSVWGEATQTSVGAWAGTGMPGKLSGLLKLSWMLEHPRDLGTPINWKNCRDMAEDLTKEVRQSL